MAIPNVSTLEHDKQKSMMKRILFCKQSALRKIVSFALVLAMAVGFASVSPIAESSSMSDLMEDFLPLAKQLYAIEEDYLKQRVESNWPAIYEYQHPEFRKRITIEEFKYFEGKVVHNYMTTNPLHISGLGHLFREHVKKNWQKKDMLGFPIPTRYRISRNKNFKVESYQIEEVEISKDEKFARIHLRLEGRGLFPPEIWRGKKEIHVVEDQTDFWENVDGNWYITLLAHEVTISGFTNKMYFLPEKRADWDNKEFVGITSKMMFGKTIVHSPEELQ